jgi:hypothetical protein
MTKAYVVDMVVLQEQPDEEDDVSDDIEGLFSDSSYGEKVMPTMTNKQVALLASFETVHREEGMRQFMAGCRAGGSRGHARGACQRGERGGMRGGGGSCGGAEGDGKGPQLLGRRHGRRKARP